jgi:hypothetical protein
MNADSILNISDVGRSVETLASLTIRQFADQTDPLPLWLARSSSDTKAHRIADIPQSLPRGLSRAAASGATERAVAGR